MRRGVAFVAAGITAFTLVVLGSVVYAYQAQAAPKTAEIAAVPPMVYPPGPPLVPISELSAIKPAASPTTASPQDAAMIAGVFLGREDAYSVELSDWNGTLAYKVTFSSGDVVYISMQGQLLGAVPPTTLVAESGWSGGGGGGGAGRAVAANEGHDDDDEHEGEHEDEHESSDDSGEGDD